MSSIELWFQLGTVGMALGTLLLVYGLRIVPKSLRKRYSILIAVPGIAVVAYALMAVGIGALESATGQTVWLPRYVDWLLTTPLHILYLGLFAGASMSVIYRALGLQALTILLGLGGALTAAPLKWALYGTGCIAFVGVIYYTYNDFWAAAQRQGGTTAGVYRKLRSFVIILWLVYPIIWLGGPAGFVVMDVETAALVVSYIDVVSKVGLGLIALNSHLALSDTSSPAGAPGD